MSISSSRWYQSKSVMMAVAAIAWLGSLIVLVIYYPKYLPDGESLLYCDFEDSHEKDNKICTKNFGCWICSENGVLLVEKAGFGSSTSVRLTPTGTWRAYMLWNLNNSQGYNFLELRGRICVENIKTGKEPWDVARCILYYIDREGNRRWDYPHTAEKLSGSSPWTVFSKIFPVPDFAVSTHILIQNSARSGAMWVDDLSLQPLRINHQFFRNRNILMGVGVTILFAFSLSLRIWKGFDWIIPVFILVSVFGVLSPHSFFEETANILNIKVAVLKKMGHFMVFFAMGILSFLWLKQLPRILDRIGTSILLVLSLFSALALFAAFTEFLQVLTLDRTPALADYLVDLSGIFSGVLLAFLMTMRGKGRSSGTLMED